MYSTRVVCYNKLLMMRGLWPWSMCDLTIGPLDYDCCALMSTRFTHSRKLLHTPLLGFALCTRGTEPGRSVRSSLCRVISLDVSQKLLRSLQTNVRLPLGPTTHKIAFPKFFLLHLIKSQAIAEDRFTVTTPSTWRPFASQIADQLRELTSRRVK